jgi:hypothetical protein
LIQPTYGDRDRSGSFSPALQWNCTKIALCKLRKQRDHTFINVAVLPIGRAACLLILLRVKDELNKDRID